MNCRDTTINAALLLLFFETVGALMVMAVLVTHRLVGRLGWLWLSWELLSHCLTARCLLFHGLLVLNKEEGGGDRVLQEAF